ncbi:hypothetical protein [Medusavirus stheno T3]|uniref:Uncharacterized protein n=1 Tax=Medusavirus stheno T3 TaxID=3069717 RepID=A0A7S7YEX1_9VIRU|nr:hypothetical protein QKU73_gp241 [Acanthamoeba castellanii medusavirus]QPB44534.1 hypothetical protein [Medusavirus stheno T3]
MQCDNNKRKRTADDLILPEGYEPRSVKQHVMEYDDDDKELGAHDVIHFALGVLKRIGARRVGDWVYVAKSTPDMRTTNFYHPYMSIADFINVHCRNRAVAGDIWSYLLDDKVEATVIRYLSRTCNDPEFPELEPRKGVFAFANGVYVASNHPESGAEVNDFFEYRRGVPAPLMASFYNPHELNIEWLTFTDPIDIPTPTLDAILQREGWNDDIKRAFYSMCIGRLLANVREYDAWGVAPMLHGGEGTGASFIAGSLLPRLASKIYNDDDKSFRAAEAFDSDLVVVRPGTTTIPQELLLSMIHGETVSVARVHKQTVDEAWRAPVVLVGDQLPSWFHTRGGRDVLLFHFSRPIDCRDADLLRELPAIVTKGVRCYTELAAKARGSNVRECLPAYFY